MERVLNVSFLGVVGFDFFALEGDFFFFCLGAWYLEKKVSPHSHVNIFGGSTRRPRSRADPLKVRCESREVSSQLPTSIKKQFIQFF